MDLMLIILMIALSIFFIFVSNYLLEKNGIKNIYLIYNVIAFILSFKILKVFEININANIVLSSLFISLTYLIIEKTSPKEYKDIIFETLIINLTVGLMIFISSLYIGTIDDSVTTYMNNVFLDNYKILISYPIVTTLTQIFTLLIYNNIKIDKMSPILRIIITNLNILMIDSILFFITSYIFKIKFNQIIILIISNYLIKVLITSLYTPFINYMISKKKVKLWI